MESGSTESTKRARYQTPGEIVRRFGNYPDRCSASNSRISKKQFPMKISAQRVTDCKTQKKFATAETNLPFPPTPSSDLRWRSATRMVPTPQGRSPIKLGSVHPLGIGRSFPTREFAAIQGIAEHHTGEITCGAWERRRSTSNTLP
jgi:hypothetical protein